jgi:hypothetical protein
VNVFLHLSPRISAIIVAAGLALSALIGGVQARTSALKISTRLTILPGEGTTITAPGQARYDFGETTLFDTRTATHVFRLRNDTDAPVTIARLMATCGCTSAVIDSADVTPSVPKPAVAVPGERRTPPDIAVLPPGGEAEVRMTVNLGELRPGRIDKTVSVIVPGAGQAAARLEIRGTVKPVITLAPMAANLGEIPAGTRRSVTLTATMDSRLAAFVPVPKPVANDTSLQVALAENVGAAPAPPGTVTRKYTVTIGPDAPLGTVAGNVSLDLPAAELLRADRLPPGITPALIAGMLRGAQSAVIARVVGDVTAAPATVAFGAVTDKAPVTRTVTLTGKDAATLAGMKLQVSRPNPRMTARLRPQESTRPGTRLIDVRFDPSGLEGAQYAALLVTLTNGQHLEIPVNGYVLPGNQPK